MPELPEVETISRELGAKILHKKIRKVVIYQSKLRWLIPENLPGLVQGATFQKIERRGRYLLCRTETGTMILHLGMSGHLCYSAERPHLPAKHEHLTIYFADNTVLAFIDPRKFGACLWTEEDPLLHQLLNNLGPEPLTDNFNAAYLATKIKNRKVPIKQLIMDNKAVVGVGNIYANEALFQAKINPLTPAQQLTSFEVKTLVAAIKQVLETAIKTGGSSIRDYKKSDGSTGSFQKHFAVYRQENQPCKVCGTLIKKIRQAGRSTFYCANCQPMLAKKLV